MLYILLGTLNDEGQQRMRTNPNLFAEACAGVRMDGAQLLGRYAVLGRFDFVILADAVDQETIARLSVELGAQARVHFETLPAIGIGHLAERGGLPLDPQEAYRELNEPLLEGPV